MKTESESEMVARCPSCRTGSWVGVPEMGTQGEEEKLEVEASSWAPKMCGIFPFEMAVESLCLRLSVDMVPPHGSCSSGRWGLAVLSSPTWA